MNKIKQYTPIFITLCIVFLFYIKRIVILKYYPPICNLFIFCIFFFSLFGKETIIQKIAKACGDKIEGPVYNYTRKVTYIWCIFTFLNLLISIWTIFLSDRIWIIYNGIISYLLVGLLFGVEYIIRINLRKKGLL